MGGGGRSRWRGGGGSGGGRRWGRVWGTALAYGERCRWLPEARDDRDVLRSGVAVGLGDGGVVDGLGEGGEVGVGLGEPGGEDAGLLGGLDGLEGSDGR